MAGVGLAAWPCGWRAPGRRGRTAPESAKRACRGPGGGGVAAIRPVRPGTA